MTKYYRLATKQSPSANSEWFEDRPLINNLTVYEPESDHHFSGLLDAEGQELYRSSRRAIGFIQSKE